MARTNVCPSDYQTAGYCQTTFWRLFSVSSSRVPKSLCWWTVAIPDLSWTYRTHTSVPLGYSNISCMSSKIVMISGCTDSQTSVLTWTRASETGAMTSAFLDTIAHEPKVLENAYHLTTCMRILLERRMSQIPQLSTSFQPKATPLAFCSRLNLITSVCKSDVLLVQKQPPRPSTKIKLKETTENAEGLKWADDQWWRVSANWHTGKAILFGGCYCSNRSEVGLCGNRMFNVYIVHESFQLLWSNTNILVRIYLLYQKDCLNTIGHGLLLTSNKTGHF
jgi:hypothetical protein